VNARGKSLVRRQRATLDTLPGATGISFHASETWTIVLIAASSDEAVVGLGNELGLGTVEVRTGAGRWWCRAMSEQGAVRVEVFGPHHLGPPPREAPGGASS
jgi:hypothetical protein